MTKPTPEMAAIAEQQNIVKLWRSYGIPLENIAEKLGISRRTLCRRFSDEIKEGDERAREAESQHYQGVREHLTAIIDQDVVASMTRFIGARREAVIPPLGRLYLPRVDNLVKREALT